MKKRIFFLAVCSFLVLCSISNSLMAREATFDILQYRPSPFTNRTISMDGADNLPSGTFSIGLDMGYAYKPFKVTLNDARSTEVEMKYMVPLHLLMSVAPLEFLSFGIDMPFVPYMKYNDESDKMNVGDMLFAAKFTILRDADYPLGLAVEPFGTFPTGDAQIGLGSNKFTGGIKLIIDKEFSFVELIWNAGFKYKSKYELADMTLGSQVFFGMGANFEVYDNLYILAEVVGETDINGFYKYKFNSPAEGDVAIRYNIPSAGLSLYLGGGAGIIRGGGAPLFRVVSGISYQSTMEEREAPVEPVMEPVQNDAARADLIQRIKRTIYFPSGTKLNPSDYEMLNQVPALFNNPELTGYSLVVAGHTDSTGKYETNKRVSLERAKIVGNYLTSMGVDASRVYVIGYGPDYPIDTNETRAGRERNRRVEIYVAQQ